MKTLNEKFGQPSELAIKKIQPFMNQMVQDFIQAACPLELLLGSGAAALHPGWCTGTTQSNQTGTHTHTESESTLASDQDGTSST